jgi:hypothetical protein
MENFILTNQTNILLTYLISFIFIEISLILTDKDTITKQIISNLNLELTIRYILGIIILFLFLPLVAIVVFLKLLTNKKEDKDTI